MDVETDGRRSPLDRLRRGADQDGGVRNANRNAPDEDASLSAAETARAQLLLQSIVDVHERGGSLDEIRALVAHQMTRGVRQRINVGATALRAVLRGRRRQTQRRQIGGGQGRGGGASQSLVHPSLDWIRFLVEEAGWGPAILRVKEDGLLALHVAILAQCPTDIVQYLVLMAPDTVQVRALKSKFDGYFPIHLAVDRPQRIDDPAWDDFQMAPLEMVDCLLDAWPESIRQTSYDGWTPLHHALRHLRRNRPNDRRVVRHLIDMWPESLAWPTEDGHGQLAFHIAVTESVHLPDLRYLLKAYPDAIRTRSTRRDKYLPIHNAFVQPNGSARPGGIAPLSTIRFLVEQNPSSLMETTLWGRLPLHLAFSTEDGEVAGEAPRLDLVQFLVESCPETIRAATDFEIYDGWNVFFYAAANPYTSPEVMQYLAEKHPPSVRARERDDPLRTAVHVAVEYDLSVAGIDAFVRAWPESLQERTSMGELPLHLLLGGGGRSRERWRHRVGHGNLLDVTRCLVTHCPSSLRARTSRQGEIPLHVALLEESPRSPNDEDLGAVVDYLLEQWPESVRAFTADRRGWLALHCAAFRGRSVRVLRSLHNCWPNSIHQLARHDKQLLPIHLAAASPFISGPSLEFLLNAWPASATEWSGEGWLPIHYAAGKEGTPASIQQLLDRHPETVRTATRDGNYLPIHLAALRRWCPPEFWFDEAKDKKERARKLQVIRVLVESDRDGLLAVSPLNGSLPLHLAVCRAALDENVVKYMIQQCPESVRHRNHRGSLPLHVAVSQSRARCRRAAHEQGHLLPVVEALVDSYPESLQVPDQRGRLPLHLAAESDHASLDVVYLLLRRRPETIQGTRKDGDDSVGGGRRQQRRCPPACGASAVTKRRRRSEAAR